MSSAIAKLRAIDPETGQVNTVIEGARGSRSKYAFDPESGLFVHDHALPSGLVYPLDFGFIPSTRGDDGDPIDVMVLVDEPAFPGAVIPARLIGAIEAAQSDGSKPPIRNDRLIAVATKSRLYGGINSLDDLPPDLLGELERFWIASNADRGRTFELLGRVGAEQAAASLYPNTAR